MSGGLLYLAHSLIADHAHTSAVIVASLGATTLALAVMPMPTLAVIRELPRILRRGGGEP